VDDCAAPFTRLDDEAEAHRMLLRHGRSHDEDRVGVGEILQRRRRPAAPERGAQTGHRGAVSYPRLIADRHHPKPAGVELFQEVVLFVVEGRAAEMCDRR
jgi:hypothetical protein